MTDAEDLDGLVRRVDPDRWLASRFVADPGRRAALIALYGLNHELARAPEAASQPLIAEMRLTWWREAVEEIFEGRPVRAHPVAQALAAAVRDAALPREPLEALAEARLRDVEGWPLRPEEVEPYVDATAGRLMALAVRALDPAADPHAIRGAARAWGLAGLSRIGRLPADWSAADVRARVADALGAARRELGALPVQAFPAAAYAALSRPYARGEAPGELGKRARITLAVARGRI
jgi:phytoene synthase